jgi:isocitrate/isopropylmalate dehydrogenase
MSKKIVILGGDGVGPEVAAVAADVLKKMTLDFDIQLPLCGEQAQAEVGNFFPDEAKKLCDEADAILFGAAGDTSGFMLAYLRWGLDNYVNIRPVKYFPGARTPLKDAEGIDFVILREGIEGMYPGREGDLSLLVEKLPDYRDILGQGFAEHGAGKFALRIITEKRSERFLKFSCDFAQKRKNKGYKGNLICVTKANVLRETDTLFYETAQQQAADYPELTLDHYYVDDMSRRILRYPKDLDVVATTNMFGDILSDEAAELVGGLGLAASACIGGKVPYFEPVHGSAPKYAGKDVINPTAMLFSTMMMLDHLEMTDAAKALEDAIAKVYQEGKQLTQDQGGSAKCSEFTKAVIDQIG